MSIIMNNKSGDTTRPVRLIFQVVDDKMQNHAWFQYDLLPYPSEDSVKRVGVKQYINLSGVKSLENKTLKLYLYNPAGSELYLDDLRLEMNGYKKNKQFIKR